MNGRSLPVLGVTPKGRTGTDATIPIELWVPASMMPELHTLGSLWEDRRAQFWFSGARLRERATLEEVRAELASVAAGLWTEYPEQLGGYGFEVLTLAETRVNPTRRDFFVHAGLVLLAMVDTVLLVACANVANLLLGPEQGDGGSPLSGAGRARIVRLPLTEAVVLFSLGCLVGLGVAYLGADLLTVLRLPTVPPEAVAFGLDLRVLTFTSAVTLLTGLVFGLIPALAGSGLDLMSTLRDRTSHAAGLSSFLAPGTSWWWSRWRWRWSPSSARASS